MDTQTKTVKQVKFTFNGLIASVSVVGSDEKIILDIAALSDEMKVELLKLGAKTKLSNYRCGDKLHGDEKIATILDCYKLLKDNTFRQTREPVETIPVSEQVIEWRKFSDHEKSVVKKVDPARFTKLEKLI